MTASKIISPDLFGFKHEDHKARFIETVYSELQDLRDVNVAPGLTRYDIADAFLDTLSNYADMGPIEHGDLAPLIRDAVEQLDSENDA